MILLLNFDVRFGHATIYATLSLKEGAISLTMACPKQRYQASRNVPKPVFRLSWPQKPSFSFFFFLFLSSLLSPCRRPSLSFFERMALSETQAMSLLEFERPLDVRVLDAVVEYMQAGGPQVWREEKLLPKIVFLTVQLPR